MKRVLLAAAIALAMPAASMAQLPETGICSLYADGTRVYYATCPFPAGYPIAKVEMWIWCLPSVRGLAGADFAVSYPSGLIKDRVTWSPLLSSAPGDLAAGYSATFSACQRDWSWVAHQTLYLTTHQVAVAELAPHPVVGAMRFLSCEGSGCCWEACIKGTSLYFNSTVSPCLPPELAIGEPSPTWGALKGLYVD